MKNFHMILEKYAVGFGLMVGLGILVLIGLMIIAIPEEAGAVMTIAGLLCSSVSMFFITKDLRKD